MGDYIFYYNGVCNPAAPAENKYQAFLESAGTFEQWNTDGSVAIAATALTSAQTSQIAGWDAAVAAATSAAQQQQATLLANQQAITANIQAHMATISAWIAANPSGAVLTASQTLVLAKMLYGIGLLLNLEFSSTTGT